MPREKKENEKDREIYALRHQISSKDKQIGILKKDLDIKDAQIKAADMFISYMAQRFPVNEDGEVVINLDELYQFASGYSVAWKKDDVSRTIIIKTEKVSQTE